MSKILKIGNHCTRLILVLVLSCLIFAFSTIAQTNPNEPLDEESAVALVEELADGLGDLIEDEDQVTAIIEKWDAREDLAGKTRTQILGLLFADVRSVVRDAETQKNIWDTWTGAADRTEEEEEEADEDVSTDEEEEADEDMSTEEEEADADVSIEEEEEAEDEEEEEADEDWSTMDDSRELNAQNVSWMLEDLQDELSDFIDNQAQIAAIVKKWRARKDLAGKTKADVTALLYADVKSIVKDKETLDDIEDSWKVSDAITNPSATKEQQEALEQLKKYVFERAEKNLEAWRSNFVMLQLGGGQEYDPEALAGIFLMREGITPAEAWAFALEGIVAFQKIENRNLLPAELEQMKEVTVKLIDCGSNCAALHQKLKERGEAVIMKLLQPILFGVLLTDKNNMEKFLGGFVKELYKGYQSMEFYDPYKIEAECRKNGGDELGCFKSTFFGMFGYGLFGKQADEKVHIDQKSLDLVNRWQKERFTKFECVKDANGKCTDMKIKTKP
jgi:hypothetical protein